MVETALLKLQSEVQNVAEAISTAVKLETEITDEHLTVVAGTGLSKKRINKKEEDGQREAGFLYGRVLTTNQAYIVEDARSDPKYDPSFQTGNTEETAEICCPIRYNGRAVGVIGLLAFTEDQQERLIYQKHDMLMFLEQMSLLLTGKIAELEAIREWQLTSQKLNTIIEAMQEGILYINANGEVSHMNSTAENLVNLKKEKIIGRHLRDIWPHSPVLDILKKGKGYVENEEIYDKKEGRLHFLVTASPIRMEEEIIGAVASFRKYDDVKKLAMSVTNLQQVQSFSEVKGESEIIQRIKQKAVNISKSPSTVLITGESGTGKGVIASAIHNASKRKGSPFVTVNCGAIPETLLESELFGYEKGAFTGASKEGKSGKFEQADGGTIFLDEVGDIPLHVQVKLLHVLQNKEVTRVGGNKVIPVDVRIIAATNKNLEEMVKKEQFRADLFFRLNVIPLEMPSLRERSEDIPYLMSHFLKRYAQEFNRSVQGFAENAISKMMNYTWPGNVRELENAVEYAINMEQSERIRAESLPVRIQQFSKLQENVVSNGKSLKDRLEEEERKILSNLIMKAGTSVHAKKHVAKELNIGLATLYRKLDKHSLLTNDN